MFGNSDGSTSGFAGNFNGDLNVSGTIFAGTKDFRIDHPLDPANKYLLHASVESSEMMNVYSGNTILDGRGQATVQLPQHPPKSALIRLRLPDVNKITSASAGNHPLKVIDSETMDLTGLTGSITITIKVAK